jgi:hypothetical protein
MTLLAAFLMPLVMLALVFYLARIEERHLTAPRVAEPAEQDGAAPAV